MRKFERNVYGAEEVTDDILKDAEEIYEGWFADTDRIDWEDFIDRLSKSGSVADNPYDFEFYYSPAISKIQRHIRSLRALA